jgi:hypothetical protein
MSEDLFSEFFCDSCDKRLWNGKCYDSRCKTNSERHLRRHAFRIRENLKLFVGDVAMLTITAPGSDLLPWDGLRVNSESAWGWNYSMFDRWASLRDVASRYARRKVPGVRSGILVVVPELQSRGVLHLHVVLGAECVLDRRWCEQFVIAIRKNSVRYSFGRQVDFHRSNWGPVQDRGVSRYVAKLGSYLTKSVSLREQWESYNLPARAFYVSRRLTEKTGLTIRMLRRRTSCWTRRGLSVPVSKVFDWVHFELAFGRELSTDELFDLVRME